MKVMTERVTEVSVKNNIIDILLNDIYGYIWIKKKSKYDCFFQTLKVTNEFSSMVLHIS